MWRSVKEEKDKESAVCIYFLSRGVSLLSLFVRLNELSSMTKAATTHVLFCVELLMDIQYS